MKLKTNALETQRPKYEKSSPAPRDKLDISATKKSPAFSRWLRRGILLMLLISAGMMIWMQQNAAVENAPSVTAQPVQTAPRDERSVREAAYAKDLAALEKLLESDAADEQTRTQAARRIQRMAEEHQYELAIEEALLQAGYQPVLVLCQNGALTVMTQENLTAEQSAAVLSICIAHADVAAENVRIMQAQP